MNPHIDRYRAGFAPGLTWIVAADDPANASGLGVGVLRLAAGESWCDTAALECAWLLTGGQVQARVDSREGSCTALLARNTVFDEAPCGLHLPAGARLELRALADCEFTVHAVANPQGFAPAVFLDVPDEHRGQGMLGDAAYRRVRTILSRDNAPAASRLVVGEVVTQAGGWAGYPPHFHLQPEIYHYRFDRPEGFGYAELDGQVMRVEHNDTVLIEHCRTHPQVAAPGYRMYFSWVIRHLAEHPYQTPMLESRHAGLLTQARAAQPPVVPALGTTAAALPLPAEERRLDVICLGRVAVDLYGEQYGCELEEVTSFAKYLGGCAGNIAVGCARQGLRVAMLSRVGNEQMGRFVRATLQAEGIDVSRLRTDPQRLTALAILSIRDRHSFPLLFYRRDCADMALAVEDFSPEFIASARALVLTGTHVSQPAVAAVSRAALRMARAAGTRVVFDIDYRPVLWGLAEPGEGDQRYVPSEVAAHQLRSFIADADLVVGTQEEFLAAAGASELGAALRCLRASSRAAFVVKLGGQGCLVVESVLPESLADVPHVPGVEVEVLNVLGAGDAFLSGLLRPWLDGEPLRECARWANLAGALVVSRHACAPAIPGRAELQSVLGSSRPLADPASAATVERLHRIAQRRGRWPELMILAFDHRRQFELMCDDAGAPRSRIAQMKLLIAQAAQRVADDWPGATGVLVDGSYGAEAMHLLAGSGVWVGRPVERPDTCPLEFDAGANLALDLRRWHPAQVVKCLVQVHPAQPMAVRETQAARLRQLFEACCATGHELLIEPIPAPHNPVDTHTMAQVLDWIYREGVQPDWWKLAPQSDATWTALEAVIQHNDPNCRGVLLLGQDASFEELRRGFAVAACRPLVRGFAVGRTIFGEPCRAWLAGLSNDADTVAWVAANYRQMIELWRHSRAACPLREYQPA